AIAEREMLVGTTRDVEAVGIGELALVAVRRARQQEDARAGGDGAAVPLDVPRGDAPLVLRRRGVAQYLLDGIRNEPLVGADRRVLPRGTREEGARLRQELGGGPVPRRT